MLATDEPIFPIYKYAVVISGVHKADDSVGQLRDIDRASVIAELLAIPACKDSSSTDTFSLRHVTLQSRAEEILFQGIRKFLGAEGGDAGKPSGP